jgi:hypothetical protein
MDAGFGDPIDRGRVLCRDCQDLQREVKATRWIGKTPVCEEHYANRLGVKHAVPAAPAEETAMPVRAQVDWEAAQRDRDAGMTTTAIGTKYGVSCPTVCAHTKPSKKGRLAMVAERGKEIIGAAKTHPKVGRPRKDAAAHNSHANGNAVLLTVEATPELCDEAWGALTLEEKADLLNRLHEED